MDQTKSTQKRNMVVLGRTGVGKSTVVNQIVGKPDVPFQVTTSLEGVTRKRRTLEEVSEEIQVGERKIECNIKIIDTVGLHDKKGKKEDAIPDIIDYFSKKPEGVNLLFFVIRKGIFIEEEEKAFDSIIKKKFIKKAKDACALIITGCEGLSDEGRKKEIQEIKTGKTTKSLAEFMGKGIYTVGFPNVENLKPFLKEEYEEGMKTDAKKLRKVVLDSLRHR